MPTIRERNGRFQAQVRIKRNGVIVHEDSATFDTRAQAATWGKAIEVNFEKGANRVLSQRASLESLMRLWAQGVEKTKGHELSRGVQHSVKAVMLAPFAQKQVGDITAQDITLWAIAKSKTLSPATVLHHIMVMRSAYKTAPSLLNIYPPLEPLMEASSALQRMRVTGRSKARSRRVSDEELAAIAAHLRSKMTFIPTDVFVRLAVALPRRREELTSMRWSDYTGTTVLLRDTKNPTRPRDEIVPVPPAAKGIIDKLPRFKGEDRIFPYKPESISAAFQRTVRELGLEDIRLHDLRHEGISRLFEAGLQIQEVAMISGHISWSALRRYTHLQPADIVEKLHASGKRPQENTAESE